MSHNEAVGYRLEIRPRAGKYLDRLPADRREQIFGKLEVLAENPEDPSLDVKKLVDREGFRLRVGDYRVIFERHRDRLLILVVAIWPRGQAYRR